MRQCFVIEMFSSLNNNIARLKFFIISLPSSFFPIFDFIVLKHHIYQLCFFSKYQQKGYLLMTSCHLNFELFTLLLDRKGMPLKLITLIGFECSKINNLSKWASATLPISQYYKTRIKCLFSFPYKSVTSFMNDPKDTSQRCIFLVKSSLFFQQQNSFHWPRSHLKGCTNSNIS